MSQSDDLERKMRDYWDEDAVTYDRSAWHYPRTPVELAVWAATLRRLLPPPPARVLDVGAGTGFLSLLLAREGYRVTALDLAPGMLAQLRAKAEEKGLTIETVEANAADPPDTGYDAVVERHLVWTLPDPRAALEAWRKAASSGTLALIETNWGPRAGLEEQLLARARDLVRRVRREPPDHHAEYGDDIRAGLPLGSGTSVGELVELVESTDWGPARVERLRDVEWATREALGSVAARLLGSTRRFAVLAG
ncbi:MAG: class I SAM-dependent methyltransferase [Acidimicrobiales bacterium]|jgi:SAM-dependent methyltransferase